MMFRAGFLAVVACCASTAPAAAQQSSFTVTGGGFGHGIGMSQYGAAGMAAKGSTFTQILGRYYQGAQVGPVPASTVRVLLQANRTAVSFTGARQAAGRTVSPSRTYQLAGSAGKVQLRSAAGRPLRAATGAASVLPAAGQRLRLLGRADNGVTDGRYEGTLAVRPALHGGVNAINRVGMETYLRGVIAAEMPSGWPAEALKAQAVAARSYALASRIGHPQFDQYADTRSQMYRGAASVTAATDQAVRATSGQVLTYAAKPIPAFFHSTSGGFTENVENVWPAAFAAPYLRGVPDPEDSISPYHRWTVRFSDAEMTRRLGAAGGVKVLSRGVSGRIVRAQLQSTGKVLTGEQLKVRLGLRDVPSEIR